MTSTVTPGSPLGTTASASAPLSNVSARLCCAEKLAFGAHQAGAVAPPLTFRVIVPADHSAVAVSNVMV
ncbi:MAG: hypothetical protein H0V51_07050 [Chloroflexi bacterium]|nr:hypothetical protein [Chloroflexota bacterium]